MRKTIKADKEERVISDFFVSDNALIEYRQKDDNTVHAVVRYVEHSSIKEVTLYIADPKKDIYSIDVSDDAAQWYFVGSNGRLYNISFDSDSETPNFSIGEVLYRLNEDNTLGIPIPPSTHPIVVSDWSTKRNLYEKDF